MIDLVLIVCGALLLATVALIAFDLQRFRVDAAATPAAVLAAQLADAHALIELALLEARTDEARGRATVAGARLMYLIEHRDHRPCATVEARTIVRRLLHHARPGGELEAEARAWLAHAPQGLGATS